MAVYLPYVYILTHKQTNEFYIGMRSANKVVAEEDLGTQYFSSSKAVKSRFSEFNTLIIAYFVDQEAAFLHENSLIEENWGNPLLLNRHYQKNMSRFSMAGASRKDLAKYNSTHKVKPKELREYKCVICEGVFVRNEFSHHTRKTEFVCGRKCNGARSGKKSAGKSNPKLSAARMGTAPWNKGIKCPQTSGDKNGMTTPEARRKMSKIAATRKKFIKEDGSWTWIHPGHPNYPTTSVTEQVGTISES